MGGDNLCSEVRKDLEYDQVMKSLLLEKLQKKYYSSIAVEGIVLKAFKEKFVVNSFRVDQLSDSLQETLRAVHALLDAEEDAKRRAAKGSGLGDGKNFNATKTRAAAVVGKVENDKNSTDGAATVSRHEQQEQRKVMRAQRKEKIEKMLSEKPSQNAEDPQDLA